MKATAQEDVNADVGGFDTIPNIEIDLNPAFNLWNPLIDLGELIAKKTFVSSYINPEDVVTTGLVVPELQTNGEIRSIKIFSVEPKDLYVTTIPCLDKKMIMRELLNFGLTGKTGLTRATISLGLGISTLSITDEEAKTLTLVFDTQTNPEGTEEIIKEINALDENPKINKHKYLKVVHDGHGLTALVMALDNFLASSSYKQKDPIVYPKYQYTGVLGDPKHGAVQAGFNKLPIEDDTFLHDFFTRMSGLTAQLDVVAEALLERRIVTSEYIASLANQLSDLLIQDIANLSQTILMSSGLLKYNVNEITPESLSEKIKSAADIQGQITHLLRNIKNINPVFQPVDLHKEVGVMAKLFKSLYPDRKWEIILPDVQTAEFVTSIPNIVQVLLYYLVDYAIKTYDSKELTLAFHDDGVLAMVNFVYKDAKRQESKDGLVSPDEIIPDKILPAPIVPLLRTLFLNIFIRLSGDTTEVSFALPTARTNFNPN